MAKIMYKGKTYEMTMSEFYTLKRADEIIEELTSKPELLDVVNAKMRKYKLKQLKNEISNR